MTTQRKFALLSGFALFAMAVLAAFVFAYDFPNFYVEGDSGLFVKNIQGRPTLYSVMMATLLLIVLLDVFVSYTLLSFFKNDNLRLARYSFYLRMCYTTVFAVANYFLLINFDEDNILEAQLSYRLFNSIWSAALIMFGIHLLLLSKLMKTHIQEPRYLWYITFIVGASYILVHFLKITMPAFESITNTINIVLALPMALGELLLATWFILKGGR